LKDDLKGCAAAEGGCDLDQELQRRAIAYAHISGTLQVGKDRDAGHVKVDDVAGVLRASRWEIVVRPGYDDAAGGREASEL
jgi:hypothetical protein